MEEKIILYDDKDIVEYRTNIEGWVDKINSTFHGKNEHMARYSACTHKICPECKNPMEKHWITCSDCQSKKMQDRYESYQYKEWNDDYPLTLHDSDTWFFYSEDIEYYCEENEVDISELKFLFCDEIKCPEIDIYDLISDSLPDEQDEAPKELQDIINEANEKIRLFNEINTLSYIASNVRTSISSINKLHNKRKV